jgi:thioredoxin-related protein
MIGKRISRRTFVGATAGFLAGGAFAASAAPSLQRNGLYEEPWMLTPTLDLSKDFSAANREGKSFAIIWETRGCPWCRLLHTVNFAREDIAAYARANFRFVQYDIRGARQVADFDGAKLPEESLSLKYDVMSTPTVQFFRSSDAAKPRELGRIGYVEPDDFFLMLKFVHEKGYESGSFEAWAKVHHKQS